MRRVKQYWLISQVVVRLSLVRILMVCVPLPLLLKGLNVIRIARRKDWGRMQTVAYYVDRFLTIFPANERGNCLPRSLVLYGFAKQYGFAVQFHCGVQWIGLKLSGHAWLSLDGDAFLEPTQQWKQFQITYSYPKPSEGITRVYKHSEKAHDVTLRVL